ncbi:MAG TPA: TIGR02996 domain-containing protein [Kofleriaceae bacterium]|nr:TIGR02996 domain-containing protein [Kofleriaceae bacterium]
MASVLAIVSKAVFEKLVKAKGAGELGDVLGIDRYTSTHASLDTLADGGSLYLVTVRPPDEALWLVGVLDDPERGEAGWQAAPSTLPITDISGLKSKLKFASGAGITAKPGALGMSLQTPRVLSDADVELLQRAAGGKSSAKKPTAKPAPAPKSAPAPKPPKPPKRGTDDGDLAAIGAAIRDGDGLAALEAALAAWRACRAPALAELVDAISARVSGPPITDEYEWTRTASRKQAVALGRLLPSITEVPVSFLPTAGQLLAGYPDDPRIASAAMPWIVEPPTTSSSTYPFWTKLLDTLGRLGDVRIAPAVAKRLRMKLQPSTFWPKYYAALKKLAGKLDAVTVPAVDDKAIGKLVRAAAALSPVEAAAPAVTAKRAPAPTVAGTPLVQAATHLAAGRIVDGIDAMLVAWRETRNPAIADRIDRATRLLPTFDRPFSAEPTAAMEAWLAAYAADPMAAIPQLLHQITFGGPTMAERRLVELTNLPDDPRIAVRLAIVASAGGMSPERTQYWKLVWNLIARTRDVRVAQPLRTVFNDFTGTYFDHHRQGRRIVGPFVMDPPAPHAVLEGELAALDRVLASLEAGRDDTERTLLDAIAADWNDEGPRLVYADWLMEREHPRAEAIVLACKEKRSGLSPAETQRLDELTGRHGDEARLYGALSDLDYELDRGIPAKLVATYRTSPLTWRELPDHPMFALVDTIALADEAYGAGHASAEDLTRLMQAAATTRLAKITEVPDEIATAIVRTGGTGWKRSGKSFVRASR